MMEILGVADILVYQRAGQKIRDDVKALLVRQAGDDRPLIALGNSLWLGVGALSLAVVVALFLHELPLRAHIGEAVRSSDARPAVPALD